MDKNNCIKELETPNEKLFQKLRSAETDIAALLWLNGNCDYCKYGIEQEYCGATRWVCKLGNRAECRPQWRGIGSNE